MPVMSICEDDGSLNLLSGAKILATMAFPNETKYLHRMTVILCTDLILAIGKDKILEDRTLQEQILSLVEISIDFPSRAQLVKQANLKGSIGVRAGTILLHSLALATHHPELELRITAIVDSYCRYAEDNSQGEREASSKSTIWDNWKVFKPVAHLYAAWISYVNSLAQPGEIIDQDNDEVLHCFAGWDKLIPEVFLSIAEDLRELAEKLEILPAETCWRAPDHFRRVDTGLEVPPLPEEILCYYTSIEPG